MKNLLKGIVTIIGAILVFTPSICIGIVFNCFYPFVMAWKEKSILTFFKILWRLLNGTLDTLGEILYQFAEKWDIMGNVWVGS